MINPASIERRFIRRSSLVLVMRGLLQRPRESARNAKRFVYAAHCSMIATIVNFDMLKNAPSF